MAKADITHLTDVSNVISFCRYRAAAEATRKGIDNGPAFPASEFPATDYRRLSHYIADAAKYLRAGVMTTEGLALYLDRLSNSAKLASDSVKALQGRSPRAKRRPKRS